MSMVGNVCVCETKAHKHNVFGPVALRMIPGTNPGFLLV